MAAVRYRAGWLVRRRWRASLLVAAVAGLVAALPIAAWAASRRDHSAFQRFVHRVDDPAYAAFFCAPDVTADQFQGPTCPGPYEPTAELAFVRSLPGVTAAAVSRFVPVTITLQGHQFQAALTVTYDGPIMTPSGNPLIVQGRVPAAVDELAVNESGALGLPLGTTVEVQPQAAAGQPTPPAQTLHLVGITRLPVDLAVAESKIEQVSATAFVAPAWWARWGASVQSTAPGIVAQLAPGTPVDDVRAAVSARWPGRPVDDVGSRDSRADTAANAVGYEANAFGALAATLALASLVFVGQAIVRQSQREQADLGILAALGFRRVQAVASTALRALPVAAGAAVVAVTLAWASSAWTPIGLGAKAEPDPGLRPDTLVYVVGGLVTALVVLAAFVGPALRSPSRSWARTPRRARTVGTAWLPPAAVAGLGMAASRRAGGVRLGTAVAALAVATGLVVAAGTMLASLDQLAAQPARYGARWDAVLQIDQGANQAAAQLAADPAVAEAGAIYETPGIIGGREDPIVAIAGLKGAADDSWSTIVAGRAPERDSEIALGATTMRAIGAHVGSSVPVRLSADAQARPLTVVGQAVFNDSSDLEAGVGGLVTHAALAATNAGLPPADLVVRLQPGTDSAQVLAPYTAQGANLFAPTPPAAVRNLVRVRWLPWALGILVAVLAVGALSHALLTSVRAHRGDLAVLRALGFTSRQSCWVVLWEAMALATVALAIGIPAGIAVGRWGWSLLAGQVGVPATPVLTLALPSATAAVVLGVSAVAALWPGTRAARVAPALALRTE